MFPEPPPRPADVTVPELRAAPAEADHQPGPRPHQADGRRRALRRGLEKVSIENIIFYLSNKYFVQMEDCLLRGGLPRHRAGPRLRLRPPRRE